VETALPESYLEYPVKKRGMGTGKKELASVIYSSGLNQGAKRGAS